MSNNEALVDEMKAWLLDLEDALVRYDEPQHPMSFESLERLQAFCDKFRPADRPRPKLPYL